MWRIYEKAKPLVTGDDRVPFSPLTAWKDILIPYMKEYKFFPHTVDFFKGGLYITPFKGYFPYDRLSFFTESEEVLPGLKMICPGHGDCEGSIFN